VQPNDLYSERFLESVDIRAPAYKLYSPTDVLLATFLGAPLGGALVMACNYWKLGKRRLSGAALLLGSIATGLALVLAFLVPDKFPGVVLTVPAMLGMYFLARSVQGPAFELHLQQGGRKASGWGAAGLGLLSMCLVLGGVVAYVLLGPDELGEKIVFGPDEEIYYQDGATEADARALGQALQKLGFFTGQGSKSVQLIKRGEQFVVNFVVQPNAWKDREVIDTFQFIRQNLAEETFAGRPVEVRLCDDDMSTKWVIH
jgi:hypothetical protein